QKKNVHLTKQAEHALKRAFLEKKIYKTELINTGHILLSILRNTDDPTTILLNRMNVDYNNSKEEFMQLISQEEGSESIDFETRNQAFESEEGDNMADKPGSVGTSQKKTTRTPVLDNFWRDVTEMATEGNLDPVVGREKEIERVSQILSRRKKNNPMLIGELGVGKSAIAEGLALRIVQKKVSRVLCGKRVVTLDLASRGAGTKYRGPAAERRD